MIHCPKRGGGENYDLNCRRHTCWCDKSKQSTGVEISVDSVHSTLYKIIVYLHTQHKEGLFRVGRRHSHKRKKEKNILTNLSYQLEVAGDHELLSIKVGSMQHKLNTVLLNLISADISLASLLISLHIKNRLRWAIRFIETNIKFS